MTLRRPQTLQSTISKAFNALDFDLRLIEPERLRFPINPTKEEQAIFQNQKETVEGILADVTRTYSHVDVESDPPLQRKKQKTY